MVFDTRNLPFEWFVGLRYFRSRRRGGFLSLITFISIFGVAVGVSALIVVLAVMNGFQSDLKERILGINSHIIVQSLSGRIEDYPEVIEKIKSIEGITSASPFIYCQGLLSANGRVSGVAIRGIDVKSAQKTPQLSSHLLLGSFENLSDKTHIGIILGSELARNLGVNLHDYVSLIVPTGRITPLGTIPRSMSFKVVGLFQSGMYQYDQSLAFVSLDVAQKLTGIGNSVMGIEIRLKDPEEAKPIGQVLIQKLGYRFWIRNWMQMNKNLFSALKLEKTVMFIILTLIVFVAAFNIVSSLIMLVINKTRDIAILKAMGATSKSIKKLFMLTGFLIGFSGTIIGLASGLVLCGILKKYHFIELPKDIYYISTLPVRVEISDVMVISISALTISLIATIYPANQAAKMNPVEALRYE